MCAEQNNELEEKVCDFELQFKSLTKKLHIQSRVIFHICLFWYNSLKDL